MCQVHTGAYVPLLAPGKTDYTACHPRKTATCILHVVAITTHTHDTRKSIGKQKQRTGKKIKERKGKKERKESEKTKKERKEKKRQEKQKKTRKARKDKTRRGSKERKREKKCHTSRP